MSTNQSTATIHRPTIQHAVVIGGSMAGLLAARALSDHAERITILDRDVLPDHPQHRRGVPQGAHTHNLLPGGETVVERLLPGIGAELIAAGSLQLDLAADVAWLTPTGWGMRSNSSLHSFSCTRELLEWGVRRRVLALPGVVNRSASAVTGLVAGDHGVVAGVRLTDGDVLEADLIVDASGRTSKAPAWLQALGYRAPRETIVDANLGYATMVVDAPYDAIPGARAAYVQVAAPEHRRGGIAVPIENDRFILTLVGTGGDHPPRDPAGFRAFARSLRDPVLANLLAVGRPGPISVFGATANRFRHYEELRERPGGFLVIGDAACAFNPVYGQGMSTAAFSAEALGACLRRHRDPIAVSRRFPAALAAAVKVPWMQATAADTDVAGIRPGLAVRAMNRYVARVMDAGTRDAAARVRMLEVMCMTRPPQALFAPQVIAAAMRRRPASAGPVPPVATPATAPREPLDETCETVGGRAA